MDYREYLIEQGKAEETIKTYISEINQYIENTNINVDDKVRFSRIRLLKYIKDLQKVVTLKGSQMNPKTINKKISALKTYCEYLYYIADVNVVNLSKNDFIKYQNDTMFSPYVIPGEEVVTLIKAIELDGDERLKMIVILLSNSGLRIHECIKLEIKHFNFREKSIFVKGKGAKYRYVTMTRYLYNELKSYIDKNKMIDDDYLFSSRQGGHICKSTVNKALKRYTRVTPHQFRHYYCSKLVNDEKAGISLLQASYQLGHSSTNTTKRYTRIDKEQMAKKIFTLDD